MQLFVMIMKDGIKINAHMDVKNWLTKEYAIKDLFGILATASVNVVNHMMLENISIIKIVSVENY